MNFRQFAFKNVFRNKRLYAGYFFSCTFSVMIFFVYSMLAFHPELNLLELGNMGQGAQAGMDVAQYIIYVFTIFFILYSMSVFLKSRKKEFGICIIQGMSDMQLRRLVFLENVIIGFVSTVLGILLGLVLSKVMLMIGSATLHLDNSLSFYMPIKALTLTFTAFVVLFLTISLFTATILRNSSLIDLLKGTTKPRPEPKASTVKAILAVLLIGIGYFVAVIVKGMLVIVALLPVVLVVTVGTYLLFTQLSVFVIHRLKRNAKLYRSKTNMITLSDLAYRMKDNARMFFFVAIISTVAFTAIGTLIGLKAVTQTTISEGVAPLKYMSYATNTKAAEHTAFIEQSLKQEGIKYQTYVFEEKSRTDTQTARDITIIKASDYNALMKENVKVNHDESVLFTSRNDKLIYSVASKKEIKETVTLASKQSFKVVNVSAMPELLDKNISNMYLLIVSDTSFDGIPKAGKDSVSYVYDIDAWEEAELVSKAIMEQLDGQSKDYHLDARAFVINMMHQGMGQMLLSGLFIGAVFFVAAGSFLYFRLYADLDNDRVQYRAISKLGLTRNELSKVVTTQMGLLFFVPIIVALIHGAVALNTLQNLFSIVLVQEIALVLGTFLLIQIVYFLFIRATYVKRLKADIGL